MPKYQVSGNQIWIFIYLSFQRYLPRVSLLRVKMAADALVTTFGMSAFVQMV